MDKDSVKKLADLARIELSNEELENFAGDISKILVYVDEIKNVALASKDDTIESATTRNVMREDSVASNKYESQKLVNSAPQSQDGFIKVKKIL